jgi:hypothetical protein
VLGVVEQVALELELQVQQTQEVEAEEAHNGRVLHKEQEVMEALVL